MSGQNQSSYRSIFKATSLFGGVQVYKIIIGIIKSKFIAVLLGPAGLGILGLLTSATDLIKQITAMGLSQSAVRDVAEANGAGDEAKVSETITVLRKLVWWTGSIGLICVAVLSPLLSKFSFGNYDYTIPFVILSVTLLIDQLSAGQLVVLQGIRRLKDLARASAFGATFGLIVSVPLYYLFGIKGIVPTLVLNSLTALLLSWFYSRKVKIAPVSISFKDTMSKGKTMLRMGVAMSISSMLTTLVAYILKGYISNEDGAEPVGIYTAGSAIISTYVGMIFTAISTDYYPRLAAVSSDNEKCREVVNQQGEVAALILGAILVAGLAFMPFIIRLLYSEEFILAVEFVKWATVGMMFKLASWLVSFQFVAKGESRVFIFSELSANAYTLVFNILGYKYMAITGLGLSFALGFLVYFIQVYLIASFRYNFSFTGSFIRVYCTQFGLIALTIISVLFLDGWIKYASEIFLCVCSCIYSYRELDKRLGIHDVLMGKLNKKQES